MLRSRRLALAFLTLGALALAGCPGGNNPPGDGGPPNDTNMPGNDVGPHDGGPGNDGHRLPALGSHWPAPGQYCERRDNYGRAYNSIYPSHRPHPIRFTRPAGRQSNHRPSRYNTTS